MNSLDPTIRKTDVVMIFSLIFVALNNPVHPAQPTYAQKIKVQGSAYPTGIIATKDGGNVLLFVDYDSDNFLIRKVTGSGNKVWQKEFHYPDSSASGIAELSDGRYILTVNSDTGSGVYPSLLKLTASGEVDWQKSLGKGSTNFITLSSVITSPDGSFFTAGKSIPFSLPFRFTGAAQSGGVVVASFESTGEMRWGKIYNSDFSTADNLSMSITTNQELIVAADIYSQSHGEGTLVLKLDSEGNVIWNRILQRRKTYLISSAGTADGGCILNFFSGTSHVILLRLSSQGTVLWRRRFIANDSVNTSGNAVTQTADGGFALTGTIEAIAGEFKGFLAKLNSRGRVVSARTLKGKANNSAEFVVPTLDSGYIVLGNNLDSVLLKLDSSINFSGCHLSGTEIHFKYLKFGALKSFKPKIAATSWDPVESSSDIRREHLKVTSSPICQ